MKIKFLKISLFVLLSLFTVSCSSSKEVIKNVNFYENSNQIKKGNVKNTKGKDYEKIIQEYINEFEKIKEFSEVKDNLEVNFKPEISFEYNGVKYIFSNFETINQTPGNNWFIKTIKDNKETIYKINVNIEFTSTTNNFKGEIYKYFGKSE